MRATKTRTKRSACGLCKPHKKGWAAKGSRRDVARERYARAEIDAHRRATCPKRDRDGSGHGARG